MKKTKNHFSTIKNRTLAHRVTTWWRYSLHHQPIQYLTFIFKYLNIWISLFLYIQSFKSRNIIPEIMFINFPQTIIPTLFRHFFFFKSPFTFQKYKTDINIDHSDILISMQIGRRFGLTGIATVKKKRKRNSGHKSITSFRGRIAYLPRFPFC